jgi:hypothetical protein
LPTATKSSARRTSRTMAGQPSSSSMIACRPVTADV